MNDLKHLLIDEAAPGVRRITLNRPEKRNALNNVLRGEILSVLEAADRDEAVRVSIIRGAGPAFCAGYDLGADLRADQPYHTAGGEGNWARHVVDGFFRISDLAKPVIAQVHGYCLAGGTELAAACDLVYVAENAQIGYPVVRAMSPPDNQLFPWFVGMRAAMEMMLTGDAISGTEAARLGYANRAYPEDALEENVLEIAGRVAQIPPELQQMNKRSVHRQMDLMGFRAAVRAGTELQALAFGSLTTRATKERLRESVTEALTERDQNFGDYRTREDESGDEGS